MTNVYIGIFIIVVSVFAIVFGWKSKNIKKVLTSTGTAITGFVLVLFGIKSKQNKSLKEENAKLKKITEHTDSRMKVLKDVSTDIAKKELEVCYVKKELPPSGDSISRIDRLNKLHNS